MSDITRPFSRHIDHAVIIVPDLDDAARCFERMGFTLTPRAQHPWGTDNRLVQLSDMTFIELLEVSRPGLIPEPDYGVVPARFSFGAHNRDFLAEFGAGMSMLALTGGDAGADAARFTADGLGNFAPFSFGRKATQPDGTMKEVAFDLAFAQLADTEAPVFFTCYNKFPENFWKPDYQHHRNGALGMAAIGMICDDPDLLTPILTKLKGGAPVDIDACRRWSFGPHKIELMTPDQINSRIPGAVLATSGRTGFTAISITVQNPDECKCLISENLPGTVIHGTDSGFWLSPFEDFGLIVAFQSISLP